MEIKNFIRIKDKILINKIIIKGAIMKRSMTLELDRGLDFIDKIDNNNIIMTTKEAILIYHNCLIFQNILTKYWKFLI